MTRGTEPMARRAVPYNAATMRIAMAQLNPTVGDVDGNAGRLIDAIGTARRQGAQLLVATELGLIGYPPRDLLFRAGVVEACERAVLRVAQAAGEVVVLVGHPRRAPGVRPYRNSVSAVTGGRVLAVYDKRLLPGYDVFDEDRYFDPGDQPCVIEVAGQRVGLLLCEDLWRAQDVTAERRYGIEPAAETARLGCDLLAVLNGSPFVLGKWRRHTEQLSDTARSLRLPIVSVNQVGGNDDLIFDGRSALIDDNGVLRHQLPGWVEIVDTVDVSLPLEVRELQSPGIGVDPMDELYHALVLGIGDYVRKTGNRRVVLGLSGGIDSALAATLAAAAIGPDNVHGLILPSRYSADQSAEDARELARNLGLAPCSEVSIEQLHEAGRRTLHPVLGDCIEGVTDENLQARLRGVLLMAYANATGALVLTTGNKSELATGYCTIYGDMCGALAVLGDLVKTRIYGLANWINDHHAPCGFAGPPIPARTMTRAPTAELKPNQTDQDTLPPYEQLDQIIERYIELEQSPQQLVDETALPAELVERWTRSIDAAQYKRDQAAIVLKVTYRTFGRGRPMPVAMRWSSDEARGERSAGAGLPLLQQAEPGVNHRVSSGEPSRRRSRSARSRA